MTPRDALKSTDWSGWVEAGLFVVAISLLNIVYAVAHRSGAHFGVFVLYATAFAAIGMLALSGLGRAPLAVIRTRQSWFYGIAAVAMELFYFLLLSTVSPAEASLAVRLTVPASLILGWYMFARPLGPVTLAGMAVVFAGVLPVFGFLPEGVRWLAFVLALTCGIVASLKTFASEFHPQNRAAETVIDKVRVTGLVVLATTIVGALVLLPLSVLTHYAGLPDFGVIPPLSAYLHWPTLLTSIGLGAPILVAMNYLTFSSAVKITTENFLALSAFTPLGALCAEILAVRLGLLESPDFDLWLLIPIAVGIVGVLMIIRGRRGIV